MEGTKLQKVRDLKIEVNGDESEALSNFNVTPKNQARIMTHTESVATYQDPVRPRLIENRDTDTAIKRHIGRQSALID